MSKHTRRDVVDMQLSERVSSSGGRVFRDKTVGLEQLWTACANVRSILMRGLTVVICVCARILPSLLSAVSTLWVKCVCMCVCAPYESSTCLVSVLVLCFCDSKCVLRARFALNFETNNNNKNFYRYIYIYTQK